MRARRWLKRVGVGLLVLVGVLVLGITAAWQYLTSEPGAQRVRALVLENAGESIAGKVEVGKLGLYKGIVVLEDVKLYTPEGELVAELKRAVLNVKLGALLSKSVVLSRADVDGLRLYLSTDERGLNLSRAVAAKQPSKPSKEKSAALYVEVEQLALQHSQVSWEKQYVLDELGIDGSVSVTTGEQLKLKAKLGARGALNGEPLSLGLAGDQGKLGVKLGLGAARLNGDFSLDDTSARIAELFVPPELAAKFAEQFPLKVAVTARGAASPRGVDLQVEAGKARAAVKASLKGTTVPSFDVHAEGIDLAELLGKGQPSEIRLDAKGCLTDPKLESLDAELTLEAAWTKVGTLKVGAEAHAGKLKLEQLALDVRGATLTARGSGDAKAVALSGELDAEDLSLIAKAIGEVTGSAPAGLAGTGKVNLAVDGPLRHPRLKADGKLQALYVSELGFHGVVFELGLADVTRLLEARLHADIARITSGERSFDHVHAVLDTRGRELDLLASTKGFADLTLTAHGTVDEDGQGLALAAFALKYPEAEWTLQSPTHVSIAGGVVIDPCVLVSADQQLALQASLLGGRVDARLDVVNLELTRLPHAFVPTKWGLGGKLDAQASAKGRTSAPEAEAKVTWKNGSVRTLRSLNLEAAMRYAKDRASGSLDGKSAMGDVHAKFDLPVKGLQKGTGTEPLSAELTLEGIVLEAVGPLAAVELPMKGEASLKLEAGGTAARPRLTAHAEVHDAMWELAERGGHRFVPVELLTLDVKPDSGDDGALGAVLGLRAFGAVAEAKVKTPLTLEGLRAKPPTAASLRAMALELEASVQHLQLAALEGANLLVSDYTGAVSLKLTARGTVDHPEAEGTVTFAQVGSRQVKPLDGELTVKATRADTRLSLAVRRQAVRLLELNVNAEAPVETLADVEKLTGVGFRGDGTVGPFSLSDVLEPTSDETQPRGTVKASIEVLGTVVDPTVRLRGQLEQVGVGKVALGKANLAFDYQRALSTLGVTLFTGGSGQLRAKGTVKLDLSQPALMKGVEWKGAPLAVEVVSSGLDLAFLSGAMEQVPKVEGQLEANARVEGTLGLPVLVGDAAWRRGRIAAMGYGEYREIELELAGSDAALTLKKLFAKSGAGWAELKGAGVKRGDAWQLRLSGETKDFPIITDDQLKATLSVELEADGLFTADLIDVRKLRVPRAVVELPEVKGKDLQNLERPESIVLVRNGVPVSAKQRKKLEALNHQVPVEPEKPARTIRITVDAPKNLWVKSSDVNAEAGLSEGFRVEIGEVASMFGEVQVKRGRLDVIGRRFDLDASSTVRFAGLPTRAYVNIIATHKNEREGVTVFATVSGQLPQFSIRLTSNPPMSEGDIFAIVATGRRTLKQGGSAAITNDQVASVLGSFAASQLKGALGKKLPLDVLSIETGSEGLKGTRVEGGKYLTDDVYLGLEARYGADPKKGENDFAAKVEYQFKPHWGVEAYGGNAAYGADLVWSREY